ncbi:VanZ family protein [Streptomyces sp. JH002]|uniref:VanZ family protein n=1 Tax=Streptomyces sp. JH002 TaxID=2763259 RepID=UPI003D80350A
MHRHHGGPAGLAQRESGHRGEIRDQKVDPRVRVVAFVLLTAYLAVAGWLMLRPRSVMWVSPPNLEPLATIRADLAAGPGQALRTIGTGLGVFAPLGVLLPLLGRRLGGTRFVSLFRTVFAAAMISLGIELMQSLEPTRVADVDSLLLNASGVTLTHLLCYGKLRDRLLRDTTPPAPSPRPEPDAVPAPIGSAAPFRRPEPRRGTAHRVGLAPGAR